MLRVILEPLLFFLIPFLGYAVWLKLRGETAPDFDDWSHRKLATLTIIGLAAAIAGVLVLGLAGGRHFGAYTPAHVENGRLAPGKIE